MTLLADLAVSGWRSAATALLLPPVPFLVLAAWGAWRMRARRRGGAPLLAAALAGVWFAQCEVTADALQAALSPPPALSPADIASLRARAQAGEPLAIVMLGGGVEPHADEYGTAQLEMHAMARLRYALWLGRQTGVPVGATGGSGPAQDLGGLSEASIADRIARDESGHPLRWVETRSRTTRENAVNTLPLLARDGVRDVWIVTSATHMPRAMRDFERVAATLPAPRVVVHAAPMGWGQPRQIPVLRWMPSGDGDERVRAALREMLGWIAGA